MARKDKLYTVNKFNRPAFMPKENLFPDGGLPQIEIPTGPANFAGASKDVGAGLTGDALKGLQAQNANILANNVSKFKAASALKSVAGGIAGAVGGMIGNAAFKGLSGGLSSGAGNAVAGIGNTIGGALGAIPGVGTLAGPAVQIATGIIGGGINAAFGTKTDYAKLKEANEGTSALNNFTSNASSLDDIKGPTAQANVQNAFASGFANKGWARKRNAELKEKRVDARTFASRSIENNVNNLTADQLNDALANYSAFGGPIDINDRNMGAIEYGFMSDYLDNGREKTESKNKMTNLFAGVPSSLFADGGGIHIKHPGRLTALKERTGKTEAELWAEGRPEVRKMITFARNARKFKHADGGPLFAFGGDMATNSSDFSTGLMHIDAGGSHEESPYDGVQLGTDSEGTPNLVEEGEAVFNNYVFSNRINIDATTKEKFHLPKKKDITYADLAKRLEKEISERPEDPISKAGFKAQMQTLEEQQERQKQEMEAQRAKEAFESLSPEEQVAVMQQASEQEAMAQQAAKEQQLAAEQQAVMQQQAQMQADGTEAALGQEASMMAEGGHLYADGSKLRKGIYNALGFHTDNEFLEWARKHKLRGDDKWEASEDMLKALANDDEAWKTIIKDSTFAEAIKDNPALADAISRGYDFGAFIPDATSNVTFKDINKGNWTAQDYEGWKNSQDPAWLEAVEKGLVKEGMKQEDIAKALSHTDAYKRGSKWLQDSENNRLRYLRTILEDENSPEVAKNYARKFIDANGWKQGAARDYASVFGANGKGVRETHPGTYWHTPIEAVRGQQAQNFVINEDGTVEPIVGDVPTDWTSVGNYSWATPENDLTYNYYRRSGLSEVNPDVPRASRRITASGIPAKVDSKTGNIVPDDSAARTNGSVGTSSTETEDLVPKHKWESLRYAGLLGPAAGLGLMAAGVGKPDTASLDAAVTTGGNVFLADYKPIGDYLTYRPMDIWYEQNALNAQSRATDRALLNSTSPSRMAGLLANSYNSQLASGDLYRKALEYNDAQRERVAGFNRGTNQFNAEAYNRLSQFNADARNRAAQHQSGLALQAAREKMDADAGWYNSLYGNVAGLFKGIGDLGTENQRNNMLNWMVSKGIFGAVNPDDKEVSKRVEKAGKKACGGKMKKGKRGLTF